jgi:putative ABC transport system permease protein
MVTPGFFPAMGIPLVRGRLLEDRDNENAQRVVLINETAAKAFFHDQDPIGKTIANSRDMKPLTIVGVVKDVRFGGLATPAFQEMYIPHSQADRLHSTMTLVVRSDSSPGPLADAVKRRVAALDPDIPVTDILTMNEAVAESIAQPRLTTQIGALFAVLALLLTVIGIYGVLAYSVSQQTQQIGIRMALGATPRNVVALILREGIRVVLAGLVVGLVACLALMRLLKSLLFGTSTNDPAILLAATATILLASLLACYIPARRAARVSPIEALQL